MSSLLQEARAFQQDFEWYPTTEEIILAVAGHVKENKLTHIGSILDIGAGDGRVLKSLANALKDEHGRKPNLLAMEKSIPLIESLSSDIGIVGTDFMQQSLMDKKVDLIFCNPPYSEFSLWMAKIIMEANAANAYLVVPQRWKTNEQVLSALEFRRAKAKVIGSFDFSNAERKARAKVDLVWVNFGRDRAYRSWEEARKSQDRGDAKWTDPFDAWFDKTFGREDVPKERETYQEKEKKRKEIRQKAQLVKGCSLVEALEELYQKDMRKTLDTYSKVCSLDPEVLAEMKIDMKGVKAALSARIEGLKNLYWRELFDNLDRITSRLTSKTRERMLSKLEAHATLDFTASNAYAVVIWAIKHANQYYEQQLIDVFEEMVDKANIKAYKSNKKTFKDEDWRYLRGDEKAETFGPFGLEYRVIVERYSAIVDANDYRSWGSINGLSRETAAFIDDLAAIARNLGFDVEDRAQSFTWLSGKANEFLYEKDGEKHTLMRVKAYKNGNVHIQFEQSFIKRLNVEYGRLKGWLKSKEQAMDELDLTPEEVEEAFGSNYKLEASTTYHVLTYRKEQ